MEKKWQLRTKSHRFHKDVFWEEIEERNTKLKTIQPHHFDSHTNSDNDDGIYRHSSHLPYVVVDLKLLEAALAKIAWCHGYGSKIYLEQDLDPSQSIPAHVKLLYAIFHYF